MAFRGEEGMMKKAVALGLVPAIRSRQYSAAASSKLALKQPTIRVVAIIAKGVPDSDTKELISYARSNNKVRLRFACGFERSQLSVVVVHKDWEFARRLGHKGIPASHLNKVSLSCMTLKDPKASYLLSHPLLTITCTLLVEASRLSINLLNANIMKSLFGCDQGATGKKEDGLCNSVN
ncbi:hypothetical protein Tco_0908455 [Tanacetum coccineum]|uniref:Uncharacterized protein n=1 Tax=Tanacetum coccineum TaxID=301880 RepID=A0ABQ5CNB3_9ASTR